MTDRRALAYVVVKGPLGPYDAGDTFPADVFTEDEAKDLIRAGVLAEVAPGEKPKVAAREATKAAKDEAKAE